MEFTVNLSGIPFDLNYTLESGQVFRWQNDGQVWRGVVSGGVLEVGRDADTLRCSASGAPLDASFVRRYFRLDDDLRTILAPFAEDPAMAKGLEQYYGMRLIGQEAWECLASFVLATYRNIPSIKAMVSEVASRFGAPVDYGGRTYHLFPGPEVLAEARLSELKECGLGYRAEFLKKVARAVARGRLDLPELASLGYADARDRLMSELRGEKLLLGVGPKVADCVLLFSCGKDEAFPIDVWVLRALARHYPHLLTEGVERKLRAGGKAALSGAEYRRVSESARAHFGPNAGYAQQYLFMLSRAEGS
jgi:N-glycosylase/DNA lyase